MPPTPKATDPEVDPLDTWADDVVGTSPLSEDSTYEPSPDGPGTIQTRGKPGSGAAKAAPKPAAD
jgi:hypothetical protein